MKGGILVFETADAALSHFLVGADIVFRKFLFPEKNVDSQSEHAKCYQNKRNEEQFHLEYEIGADWFVIINLIYDAGKYLRH